jgi:hypothetical protein
MSVVSLQISLAFLVTAVTERCGQVVSTAVSYLGASRLKAWPRDRLSLGFPGFTQSLQAYAGVVLQIAPLQFPFISFPIHLLIIVSFDYVA